MTLHYVGLPFAVLATAAFARQDIEFLSKQGAAAVSGSAIPLFIVYALGQVWLWWLVGRPTSGGRAA